MLAERYYKLATRIYGLTKCEEVTKMLTNNERKTIERLGRMMQNMNDMQKAQLCAFTEGLAMALEDDRRAS
jgi:hypothetical protein